MILYFDKIDISRVGALAAAMGSRVSINAAAQPYIALKTTLTDSPVALLRQAIDVMAKA